MVGSAGRGLYIVQYMFELPVVQLYICVLSNYGNGSTLKTCNKQSIQIAPLAVWWYAK